MKTSAFELPLEGYKVANSAQIVTPALLVFHEVLLANISKMVSMIASPDQLRPHCKTHKMPAVIELLLQAGIRKHKAATFAEAEMLADAGVSDIFLAYNLVGPNMARAAAFQEAFPDTSLAITGDDEQALRDLAAVMAARDRSIQVLIDIDTGQHRTGLPCGETAQALYQMVVETPGLEPGGLHLYDGHNHQTDIAARRSAVLAGWETTREFARGLLDRGLPVPRIVAGGTGSFPVFTEVDDPLLELSPGTCIFHDVGYGQMFPDLQFQPAALLLTRVISRPTVNRVTLDLGYKAVASDPPAEHRVVIPQLPDAEIVLQNEEHLVIETSHAADYAPGDELLAVPRHICPTSALHKQAFLVREGRYVEDWPVAARDRWLTV